jgi:hypothetical protein
VALPALVHGVQSSVVMRRYQTADSSTLSRASRPYVEHVLKIFFLLTLQKNRNNASAPVMATLKENGQPFPLSHTPWRAINQSRTPLHCTGYTVRVNEGFRQYSYVPERLVQVRCTAVGRPLRLCLPNRRQIKGTETPTATRTRRAPASRSHTSGGDDRDMRQP